MAREERKDKAETIKRELLCMLQVSENHHAICECIYTRVPDILVAFFGVYLTLRFFRIAKIRKIIIIVPAKNTNQKIPARFA